MLEENTLSIDGVDSLPLGVLDSVKFEIKRKGETTWYEIQDEPDTEFTGKARVAGEFIVRATLDLNGTEVLTDEEEIEVKFPSYAEIKSDGDVEARRMSDWNAASAAGGDHNERGGWIYLNTKTEQYNFVQWPVGTFFGVTPVPGNPVEEVDPKQVAPNGDANYFVGEYHLHATLRNQQDIANAAQLPVGPSPGDESGAAGSIPPAGAPGLLRDRHLDEIVATGFQDFPFGPDRGETP